MRRDEGHHGGRPARVAVVVFLVAGSLSLQVGGAPSATAAATTWSPAGSLGTAREHHTATALPNGRVLVAGGLTASGATASAEIYDPVTRTWSPTGSLMLARYWHTATLLNTGKVLVAGGLKELDGQTDNATDLDRNLAELYDPATGTWSPSGPLVATRYGHTATLLSDGRVLVAGGELFFTPSPSAELYDPATGTWSATGPLRTRRVDHSAVLLDRAPCGDVCGMVLVAGGQNETNPTTSSNTAPITSAELYDPEAGTWSATSSLATARSHHGVTLLDNGKVLISGGNTGGVGRFRVVNWQPTAGAELYDPVTRTWAVTGSLSQPRAAHTATLLDSGHVLATGGRASSSTMVVSAETYDPATATWTPAGAMAMPRSSHTATLLQDGKALVAGGAGDTSLLATSELYGSVPSVAVGDVALVEGDSGPRAGVFTVSLSNPAGTAVSVAYTTSDSSGTAPGDYGARTGILEFAPGVTSLTVKVPVVADKVDEPEESFHLVLSAPDGVAIADGTGMGTIIDDDPAGTTGPRLTIGNVTVHEGDAGLRTAVLNVALSKASGSYVSVNYATANGSATKSSGDYTPKAGTLTFAPGTTSLSLKVVIRPDDAVEIDESFTVGLSGSSGPVITRSTGTATIVDDD